MAAATLYDTPEEVIVIGGGIEGCLTALMATRVKKPSGKPQYHVTIIEEQDQAIAEKSGMARLPIKSVSRSDAKKK